VFHGARQRLWASSRAAIAVIIAEIDLDLVHFILSILRAWIRTTTDMCWIGRSRPKRQVADVCNDAA